MWRSTTRGAGVFRRSLPAKSSAVIAEPALDLGDHLPVGLAELRVELRGDVHGVRHARVDDDLVIQVAGRGDRGVGDERGPGNWLQRLIAAFRTQY